MNMIQKLKKNKKGFTLVELLVVLVILAILAAAIIPSMMGFIDKAKEESHAAECRNVQLAADVLINELYGKGELTEATILDKAEVKKIAGVKGEPSNLTVAKDGTHYYLKTANYVTSGTNAKTYYYTTKSATDGAWSTTPPATNP